MGGAGASPASFLLPRQHQTPPETRDFSGNGARLRLEGVFRHDAKTGADGSHLLSSKCSPPSPASISSRRPLLRPVFGGGCVGIGGGPLGGAGGFCS
ncbi:hypothetical protein HanPI659440_Chr05g0194731 [Helianthus annuus]|nr:hypothetical protein HanPI659440_Chr05g0194731 [Helianthus annuus]